MCAFPNNSLCGLKRLWCSVDLWSAGLVGVVFRENFPLLSQLLLDQGRLAPTVNDFLVKAAAVTMEVSGGEGGQVGFV